MYIGITFDLREAYLKDGLGMEETAEFDSEETISAIEATLNSLGHRTIRVGNAGALIRAIVQGMRWDLVFNICEGVSGRFRESLVPALLEMHQIPYTFSDPLSLAISLDKAMAKKVVASEGVPTPRGFLVNSLDDLKDLPIEPPLFIKPNNEGTGKGIDEKSLAWDKGSLRKKVEEIIEKFRQPALVEEYLPGREFTVGIIGEGKGARVIGTIEIVSKGPLGLYSYHVKESCEELREHLFVPRSDLRNQIEGVALKAYRALGLRDAGRVDIRLSEDGQPMFLEANPLPGLHPVSSDLPTIAKFSGMTYEELIGTIIQEALKRMK